VIVAIGLLLWIASGLTFVLPGLNPLSRGIGKILELAIREKGRGDSAK
jgi:hypothetical protein